MSTIRGTVSVSKFSSADPFPCAVASCVRSAAGSDERSAAKARLVRALLNRHEGAVSWSENLSPVTGSSYENRRAAGGTAELLVVRSAGLGHNGLNDAIRLTVDSWGCPILMQGDHRGPAVSFTHLGLKTWAALSVKHCAVGIDAAVKGEFTGRYPFHRAFQAGELDAGPAEAVVEASDAAAAVWSVKEAAVKALGCGFRLLDPLDVRVSGWRRVPDDFVSKVTFSERARQRLASARLQPLRAWTFSDQGAWVSVTVVDSSLL